MKNPGHPRRLPSGLLSFVFFASGLASLIYQVAWQRLLTLHYGVGSVSTALIVSVFMAGLGGGALLGGFLAERIRRRILLYFAVQAMTAVFGLASLPFLHLLGRMTAGIGHFGALLSIFAFLCLPTFLMGMTLPLLTKIFNERARNFLGTVSFLYFINTIGAAAGALIASYGIISFIGLDGAIYVAAAIDVVLAALILIARSIPSRGDHAAPPVPCPRASMRSLEWRVLLLASVVGFLAIGYEIVWFRLIGVLVKASPYAFSTVLSIYLLGIALGSFAMNRRVPRLPSGAWRDVFFGLQLAIAIYAAASIAGYYYATKHTFLGVLTRASFGCELHPSFAGPSVASLGDFVRDCFLAADVLLWPLFFVLPPAILMGASFPLLSSLALSREDREAQTVGATYFFSILGNVLGGSVTGFLLLPILGTEITLVAFAIAGILLAATGLACRTARRSRAFRMAWAAACVAVAIVLPGRGSLYEAMHTPPGDGYTLHLEEGVDGTIVTHVRGDSVVNSINGLAHGGRPGHGYLAQAIEAVRHAASLDEVLIIGYGTGSTTEAVLKADGIGRLTIVELSATLLRNLRKIPVFADMLSDPRIDLIVDDGRRYLQRTERRFDLILMDPLRTTTAYSNNLYSLEFFALARAHLKEEGILMTWLDERRVLPKTILSAFGEIRVYRDFCIASPSELRPREAQDRGILASFPRDARDILSRLLGEIDHRGGADYVRERSASWPVNRDWRPVCEYYLGMRIREARVDSAEGIPISLNDGSRDPRSPGGGGCSTTPSPVASSCSRGPAPDTPW